MKDDVYYDLYSEHSLIQIGKFMLHFYKHKNFCDNMEKSSKTKSRMSALEEIILREKIQADTREQKEDTESLRNNFQIINSLIFPNDDFYYVEYSGTIFL